MSRASLPLGHPSSMAESEFREMVHQPLIVSLFHIGLSGGLPTNMTALVTGFEGLLRWGTFNMMT